MVSKFGINKENDIRDLCDKNKSGKHLFGKNGSNNPSTLVMRPLLLIIYEFFF